MVKPAGAMVKPEWSSGQTDREFWSILRIPVILPAPRWEQRTNATRFREARCRAPFGLSEPVSGEMGGFRELSVLVGINFRRPEFPFLSSEAESFPGGNSGQSRRAMVNPGAPRPMRSELRSKRGRRASGAVELLVLEGRSHEFLLAAAEAEPGCLVTPAADHRGDFRGDFAGCGRRDSVVASGL